MAKRFYVLWNGKSQSSLDQIKEIKTGIKLGHTIVIGGIGELTLREDADGMKKIHFVPSPMLTELETPQCLNLTVERTKCVHRLTADDVPRGINPDDVTLLCENDPKCPNQKGGI